MPTYDYECEKCGHTFEFFQSITAEPLQQCPECQGKVKRLIGTGAGIIFKGSGFYQTDYRSDSYQSQAKKDKESSSSTDSKSSESKTTESKSTDKKTETKKTETKSSGNNGKTKAA